jgi:3-(3-hydroxy-phenyl)propionate hydroxylase
MLPQPRVRDALGEPVLLDDAIGNGFALIAFGRSGEQALRELSNPLWARLNVSRLAVFAPGEQAPVVQCDIRAVIDDGGTLSAVSDGKIILVRPDRYIAGTFAASAETRFADSLGATLGCPPTDERANLTVPAGKGPHIPDIWRNDEHITSAKPDATASSVH